MNTLIERNKTVRNVIPGDVVSQATSGLPERERSVIRRFHSHYIDRDLSLEDAGKYVGLDSKAVSSLFRGAYDGDLHETVTAIESFLSRHPASGNSLRMKFVEWSLSAKIWKLCEAARDYRRIGYIFGEQQIGKTEPLKAFRDKEPYGQVVYVALPTGGGLQNFLYQLKKVLHIGETLSAPALRVRIKSYFRPGMLFIVDEAHQCLRANSKSARSIDCIEFAREIFNETGCGLIICATNVFRDAMENEDHPLHGVLLQSKRRRLCFMQCESQPTQADLNKFSAAFGLPPSEGRSRALESGFIKDEGLGFWITVLLMGQQIALKRKIPMAWQHVILANLGLNFLEGEKRAAAKPSITTN